jgi:UDP-N-acetylmuramoyl-tripeptide--D-alanyl-D-alanine ligase
MKKTNPIINYWFTPKFPKVHYDDNVGFFKKWIFNPAKRWLAKYYLVFLQKFTHIKVIGITGSAGKTTVKEMLASILKLDGKTIYTPKNIDPIYSIPNTILKTPFGSKYLVLEMGVEYPNEMDFYLWLAKPDVGIITNIFPTHTEFLGDISGVFEEKIKLVLSLSKDGKAILNSGDKMLESLVNKLASEIIWFTPDDNPMIQNANSATVLAKSLGINNKTIETGLIEYKKPVHRLEVINHKSGTMILDDSYNSNPWAALSTLNYFEKIATGQKIAVLGDMLELGKYDEDAHRELGRSIADAGFEIVIGVGKSCRFLIDEVKLHSINTKTYLFNDVNEAIPIVKRELGKNVSILVKGSHSIHLERLVDALR